MRFAVVLVCTLLLVGCTSSFAALRGNQDSAINELRMEVADLRHALHGTEVEVKLLEERLESTAEMTSNSDESAELKRKIAALEKTLAHLSTQTSATLSVYKHQIASIESKFDEISKLRSTLMQISKASSRPEASLYQVKSGDSLGDIARRFQTSVEKLKRENHLSSDKIVAGQELAIPQQ